MLNTDPEEDPKLRGPESCTPPIEIASQIQLTESQIDEQAHRIEAASTAAKNTTPADSELERLEAPAKHKEGADKIASPPRKMPEASARAGAGA